ncbi:hypothetical protein ABZX77_40655 [Streptomyces sp. NPDC004237]|uniref:hypothetical protein n=1 Tax=Streptomyces sp. NPDC004237 TaxID=3154455 RepID=UPI0033B047B3
MNQPSIEDLAREREQLQADIREAHGVLKDLRQAIKEARQEIPRLMADKVSEQMQTRVAEGLDAYKGSLDEAIEQSTARVMERFDTLAAMLMGEDKSSRRRGETSIPDLFKTAAALQRAERRRPR